RVIRRLDDRLAGTVERGVEDDGHPGKRLETAQEPMEGTAAPVDSLDTRGAVDVGDGRQALRFDLRGKQHVRRGQGDTLEPVCGAFGEDSRSEWTPGLTPLDAVHPRPVLRLARIGQNRAMAECARADFAAALEPADDPVIGEVAGSVFYPVRG